MSKTVYVGMAADILHDGHISVIDTARRYGDVVIGLLTDQVVSTLDQPPHLDYERRKRILENIVGVKKVVPQEGLDYVPNLRQLRPDYLIHDGVWLNGTHGNYRDRALAAMTEWGGQIIDMAYADGVGHGQLRVFDVVLGTTPTIRLRQLRRQLAASGVARVLEVHSPLCGIIAESATAEHDGRTIGFDAMWSSSLIDSTVRGKPDIEAVDHSARFAGLNELFEVTTKPLLYDADTGGRPEHFAFTVRSLERLGVSAVIIEDKIGLKRNSLLGNDVVQARESIENFCYKISAGKAAQATNDFAIIGRIESFILNAGIEDALLRAKEYVAAGADGIMIHSRKQEPDEIFAFCDRFRKADTATILVAVPTTYSGVYERELNARGVNVVIYANHLLRASYPAMMQVARTILENGRCREVDSLCMPVDSILRLVPGTA
jgi:phosphoenolpyruvate phosphomutase / 2-hydroxyethylphosphonate cytidylyltransferase